MQATLDITFLKDLFDANAERRWNAVAVGFLLNNDREIAVVKLGDVLQKYIHGGGPTSDLLAAELDFDNLSRADFHAIALKLVNEAEATVPRRLSIRSSTHQSGQR